MKTLNELKLDGMTVKKAALFYLDWDALHTNPKFFAMTNGDSVAAPSNYQMIQADDQDAPAKDAIGIAEGFFAQFNIGDHGGRNDIRSMSVGDVVVFVDQFGTWFALKCAGAGWTVIDDPIWDAFDVNALGDLNLGPCD